jgi:hypothetical protein
VAETLDNTARHLRPFDDVTEVVTSGVARTGDEIGSSGGRSKVGGEGILGLVSGRKGQVDLVVTAFAVMARAIVEG